MFKTMKQLFTPTNKDLRHRIYFTLGALMIFILGISIRVPGTEDLSENLSFLEFSRLHESNSNVGMSQNT